MNDVRRSRAFVLVTLLLFAAVACSTGEDDGPTTEASGQERVDPELVVATGVDASRIDPPFRATVGIAGANASIFQPLVALAPDFTIEPMLATGWEFRPPNTWRFLLRRGVTFHNGTPFDAKAVVYMVEEIWAKNPSNVLSLGSGSATIVDDFTVDLTPTKPNRRLVEQLVHPQNGIQAPGTFAGPGTAAASTPTGTGPFRFSTYRKDDVLQVERFEGYWGAKPKAQRMTFRFIPDSNARVLALKAGEVDAIYDFPREQVAQFAADADVTPVKSPVGAYDALLLNHRASGILADLRVRQAVTSAIDKAAIVTTVWKGNAEVMQTLIPASVLGPSASAVKGHPFDQARARRLLDETGWAPGPDGIRAKAGRRLELAMVLTRAEVQTPAPELLQAQLKDVGIDVKLSVLANPAEYFDRVTKGNGDIFVEIGNQHDANPIFLGALFTAEPGGFPDYATSFGAGPQYDTTFTRAIASPDTDEVRRLAADAMHIAVDEVVAAVPFAGIYRIWGLGRNVRGFVPHPSDVNQRWSDVYVAL